MSDAIAELCGLLKEAGLTPYWAGPPVEEERLPPYAQVLLGALRSAAEEIEAERRAVAYWRRKTEEAREDAREASRCRREMADERDALKETVRQFIDLHAPRTPAVRRRYDEDERGWNMMLHGAVLAAVANWREGSDPVCICEVCGGHGGGPLDESRDWEECVACDGEGEVSR